MLVAIKPKTRKVTRNLFFSSAMCFEDSNKGKLNLLHSILFLVLSVGKLVHLD